MDLAIFSQPLTERRKADRAIMAAALAERMAELGATATIEPERDRRTIVRISVKHGDREATIGVDFDGSSTQPDVYVATWNTRNSCFSGHMGDVNPAHFGKATRIADRFDVLAATLARDVRKLADGRGFSPERERELRERYAKIGWRDPFPHLPALEEVA